LGKVAVKQGGLRKDAELPAASDLDVMAIVANRNQSGTRRKFVYHDLLLEVSSLEECQFESAGASKPAFQG
jgi:hypothetical protein